MTHNSDKEFFDYLVSEYNQPFSGWDMSYIEDRSVTPPNFQHAWNYTTVMLEAMKSAHAMLDMGTGGGERLASFAAQQPLPEQTYATEGYAPNVPIARQRLAPLGITVHEGSDDSQLPFADNTFDLVINRHTSYAPHEVQRILKPDGLFITQQVGDQTNQRIHELLGHTKTQNLSYTSQEDVWDLTHAVQELQAGGWRIVTQQEEFYPTHYYDVGAIVYYLKAIPWEIPDFSVEKYFDRLVETHRLIQQEGYVEVQFHQFLIVAKKM
jgi:SAM-dependent methyltransferase